MAGLLRLAGGRGRDTADAATMLRAEDRYDLCGDLHRIRAATLVVHGERDRVYPLGVARRTRP